jgi:PBP4 family serine-type D-alanyl-D-alanine carboxypeptidase
VVAADRWSRLIAKYGIARDNVGLVILDADGDVITSINGDKAFLPASNQKVLTAFAALERLGPDFQYETVLSSDLLPTNGVLESDLVVSGNGDPNISGRFANGNPTEIFREWAAALRKAGLLHVRGDLLVDDFRFDHEFYNPAWNTDHQYQYWYSAQVGALNLNDNCLDLRFLPGTIGKRARMRVAPDTSYVNMRNKTTTDRHVKPVRVDLRRALGTNDFEIRGKISKRLKDWSYASHVTIHDPGLFFGTVLKEILISEGIAIDGNVMRDRDRLPTAPGRTVFHRHLSPLKRDLPVILTRSQNLHAEVLLKAVGASLGTMGSVESGARVVEAVLDQHSIPRAGLRIADGSGYSRENRLSPKTLAFLLQRASQAEYFGLFRQSLAVAATSGTLKRRFRSTDLKGKLFAKTGYIKGVSTLSGYIQVPRPAQSAAGQGRPQPASAGQEAGVGARVADVRGAATGNAGAKADSGTSDRFWTFVILINGFPAGGLAATHRFQEAVATEIFRRH